MSTLICDSKQLKKLSAIQSSLKTVKNIIYIEEDGVEVASSDVNGLGDITVSSISEVEKLGKEKPVEPSLPSKNGVAVIMFTSGSTGLPKVCWTVSSLLVIRKQKPYFIFLYQSAVLS